MVLIIIWLLHNLVEASFDLFRYLLVGDQLKPWEPHPLVSYTSKASHEDLLRANISDITVRYYTVSDARIAGNRYS